MTFADVKDLMEKAEHAKKLMDKITYLQEKLDEFNKHQLKAAISFKFKHPSPSEYSNAMIWNEFKVNYIDVQKFEKLVNDELYRQLEEYLKLATEELESLQ